MHASSPLTRHIFLASLALLAVTGTVSAAERIAMKQDAAAGRIDILVDGRLAFAYRYGPAVDLAHYYPLLSPSGKNMLVQVTDPYPHHRSFWFVDRVQLDAGPVVNVYSAINRGEKKGVAGAEGRLAEQAPFPVGIRHAEVVDWKADGDEATLRKKLVWYHDGDKPLADEYRIVRIVALGKGEYLLDITFKLTAAHGDLTFHSDAVHYAWPYLRINKTFNGKDGGGTITNDRGATGQEATNMRPAKWVDYSNTVDGTTEGLAVFQWPDGKEHKWLTREYGTFGPRRPDARSGKQFTVAKGDSITQHVGVLVHRGDVESGRVAERYEGFVGGEL